jgi:hypothetical protein
VLLTGSSKQKARFYWVAVKAINEFIASVNDVTPGGEQWLFNGDNTESLILI